MRFRDYYRLTESLDPQVFANFSKAFDAVQARTAYGRRAEVPTTKSFAAYWSNASRDWNVGRMVPRGFDTGLDANVILIPAKNLKEAKLIAQFLPPLPLDAFSHENNPMFSRADNPEDIPDVKGPTMSDKQVYFDRLLDYYNSEMKS